MRALGLKTWTLSVFMIAMCALAPRSALASEESPSSAAQAEAAAAGKVRYRSGKDVSFDELLIQGQLKRPEVMVVTGNADQGTNGLLRLRENFVDRVASDYAEGEAMP